MYTLRRLIVNSTNQNPGSPVVVSAGVERGGEEEVGGVTGQLAHAQVEVGALQVEVRGQEDAPGHQVTSIQTDSQSFTQIFPKDTTATVLYWRLLLYIEKAVKAALSKLCSPKDSFRSGFPNVYMSKLRNSTNISWKPSQ